MASNAQERFIDVDSGLIFNSATEAYEYKAEAEKEEEENRKNPPFFQLTKNVTPGIIAKIANESATGVQVLMFFLENMDENSNILVVSQKVIAEKLGKTRQGIVKALKVLEDNYAIGIGKVSNANVYIVNPSLVWQKGYKDRGTVRFRANVILGEDENKKLFEKFGKVNSLDSDIGMPLKMNRNETVSTKVVKPYRESTETTDEEPPEENDIPDDELPE